MVLPRKLSISRKATMRLLLATIFCLTVAANFAVSQNAIVTENQIEGFTTNISVNHGSTVRPRSDSLRGTNKQNLPATRRS